MPFEIPQPQSNIEPGTYTAILEKVEVESEGGFNNQPYRRWHWIVDVKGTAQALASLTSVNTGPKSKSYEWLTAILGAPPKAGDTIADPTGMRVLLAIGKNDKGYDTVTSVMPFTEPAQVVAGLPR